MNKLKVSLSEKAFTLVELSIVLVIVGLLVAGAMKGQEMITLSKIKKEVNNIENYRSAFMQFKSKYKSYPGDFTRASSMISGVNASHNGNGNNTLDSTSTFAESFYAWEHVGAAGLIDSKFSGSANISCPVDSCPVGAFNGSYIYANWSAWLGVNAYGYSSTDTKSFLFLDDLQRSEISGEAAYAIDLKMDNGEPDSGNIMAFSRINGSAVEFSSTDSENCVLNQSSDGTWNHFRTDGTATYNAASADTLSCFFAIKLDM